MLARVRSKSFKLGFSSTWTENFQMFKLDLEMAEEPEIKSLTFVGSWRKQGNSRKTSASASMTTLKLLTMWIMTNCGKFSKRWEYQTTLLVSWETNLYVGQEATVRTEHGATDWFKIGKGVWQECILSPAYLTSMQSTSCEMPGWMNHKLESRFQKKYQKLQICRWYHSNGRK